MKTLERTCWQFFFVLPHPARVAERVGTEMAQLDGKVLILAETAFRVELAVKMVVISAEMVVNPRFSDIRIMRCRGLTLVKEGGLCKRQE